MNSKSTSKPFFKVNLPAHHGKFVISLLQTLRFVSNLAGVLFLLLAFVIALGYWDTPNRSELQATKHANAVLHKLVRQTEADYIQISDKICSGNTLFASLRNASPNAFCVFKNGELVYWPQSRFIPSASLAVDSYKYKIIKASQGRYLLVKYELVQGNDTYLVLFIIPFTQKYPVENVYLKSGPNIDIFGNTCSDIHLFPGEFNVYTPDHYFLCSLSFFENTTVSDGNQVLSFIFFIAAFFIAIRSFFSYSNTKTHNLLVTEIVFWLLLGLCMYFYLLAILPNFFPPKGSVPTAFAALLRVCYIIPSLACILRFSYRLALRQQVLQFVKTMQSARFVLVVTLQIIAFYIFIDFVQYIEFGFSQSDLDVSLAGLLQFGWQHGVLLFVSALYITLFFLMCASYLHVLQTLTNRSVQIQRLSMVFTTIGMMSITIYFLGIKHGLMLLAPAGYMFLIHTTKLNETLYRIRYITYLYVFIAILLFSGSIAWVKSYTLNEKKQQFLASEASKIIETWGKTDADILFEIRKQIENDHFITFQLKGPLFNYQLIADKIKRYYLHNFLENYEVRVLLFDQNGNPFSEPTRNYFSIKADLSLKSYRTVYPSIYKKGGVQPGYFISVPVRDQKVVLAYLLIEVVLKRNIPNSVTPELFREAVPMSQLEHISYAQYSHGELVATTGPFNYNKYLPRIDSTLSSFQSSYNYQHHIYKPDINKGLIISIPEAKWVTSYAYFSFWFLFYALVLGVLIVSNTFYVKIRQANTSFTTKIQLFLNAAFFVPLATVSLVSFWVIAGTYTTEIEESFLSQSSEIAHIIARKGPTILMNEDWLATHPTSSDVIVYDQNGQVLDLKREQSLSEQLFSNYLNPEAYVGLIEQKESGMVLHETYGKFTFKTAYHTIIAPESGKLLGVLAIPFLDSNKAIQSKVADMFAIMLGIFNTVFMLFLMASYFASRTLTKPLAQLTQKIKSVTLGNKNEPLKYASKDEIGILVSEYNKMLVKLEESSKKIAEKEKELAWRDIAKQLAHEIKNPLTPMKLILQSMELKSKRKEPILLENNIEVLLNQINNLNDIVTSFSTFTQMPDLKMEAVQLTEVVRQTVALFESENNTRIQSPSIESSIWVQADAKLLGRICLNLLINARESVPEPHQPIIKMELTAQTTTDVTFSITDNGMGIPTELHAKVFQPNFSTKTHGSGIGLAVAQKGIEQMGGKIWLESIQNRGTTFFIQLKRASLPPRN